MKKNKTVAKAVKKKLLVLACLQKSALPERSELAKQFFIQLLFTNFNTYPRNTRAQRTGEARYTHHGGYN